MSDPATHPNSVPDVENSGGEQEQKQHDVDAKVVPADAGKEQPQESSKLVEEEDVSENAPYATVTYMDIFRQFVLLGWTAFGGPAAHIGLFQTR